MLLILFGIIDFGFALNRQLLLTEAAREGARAVAVGGAGTAEVREKVRTLTGEYPTSLTVTACPADATAAADATVVLSYSYAAKTPLGSMMLLFGQDATEGFELGATGVMACVG